MRIKGYLLALVVLQCCVMSLLQAEVRATSGDCEYSFSGVFRPETFYGRNINWQNNENEFDRSIVSKHVLDLSVDLLYGAQTYGENIAECLFQVRNKGIWGAPESIASTTFVDIKILDAIRGTHNHGFPRHVFWFRQLWLKFNIDKAFGVPFKNKHTFTVGAFPFQLGRGIALGDSYASAPEVLGFWADSFVDQYAFGAKFSGEIFPKIVSYDVYAAILQNSSTGLSDTEKVIYAQATDRTDKELKRGFGHVNYIIAGRFNWNVFDNEWLGRLALEPYGMYNNDPEQKIEFPADASSKLGTAGLAGEFFGKRFECGFDCAVNFGQQRVHGWDRNITKENNNKGVVVLVNDKVTATYTNLQGEEVTEQAPFVPKSKAQEIINTTDRDELQNGQQIGEVGSLGYLMNQPGTEIILKNSKDRFGNKYTNLYKGWMFVADAGYWFRDKNLFWSVAGGVASGDDNPNFETKDGDYNGFIGLQQTYSGKRVRSVYLLGGAGKLKRPFSTPSQNQLQAPNTKAQNISGLSNLVFCGTALKWTPKSWAKFFEVNPNVYAYWQEHQIGSARTFLGTEANIFINYSLLKDLKIFWVSSMFFPGSHYADRKDATALTPEEAAFYNSSNPTSIQDRIPNLGNDIGYTFNLGLIYAF
jgi:hypothetical protein